MGNGTKATFLCANCEEDFDGFPSGARNGDRRPLCARCTISGVNDGTAFSHEAAINDKFSGIKVIGFGFAVVTMAFVIAVIFLQKIFR